MSELVELCGSSPEYAGAWDAGISVIDRYDSPVLVDSRYDQDIRCPEGARLEGLFEQVCDRLAAEGRASQLAVDSRYAELTYHELDSLANQLARYLLSLGARAGDRIGLLLDQSADSYIAMLAVLKIKAAYVPLDAGFPPDRIGYILSDAGVRLLISVSSLADRLPDPADCDTEPDSQPEITVVFFDEAAAEIGRCDHTRLGELDHGGPVDQSTDLAYLIYTSGSTGRPKGVAISHASICNFVLVASEVYGVTGHDRVYQGLSVAFDFSVEEIWVAWMVGATLVPKPAGPSLLADDLHEFLVDNRVTALCCVPTLLATLVEDIPEVRFVLVSGEACPRDLMVRWHRPDRRFLNVYGPTEATVSATWTVLDPERPVTIGVPLPTYSVVILDPEHPVARHPGESGEIGIAGVGLADGYLNRDDLTEKVFIPDFLDIPNNPSGRIYRTGDLGRVNAEGEIEFLGRIDTQVKIRGYRIELTEIESVLLALPEIAQAVVDTHQPEPDVLELVAYYTVRPDRPAPSAESIRAYLHDRLPTYMVPSYFEQLAVIPMTTADKADRKALPAPTGRRGSAVDGEYVAPSTPLETVLAEALSEVLRADAVSVASDFFTTLGADSLLMARFCGKLRALPDITAPSMREIYQNPTIQRLAASLSGEGSAEGEQSESEGTEAAGVEPPTPHEAGLFGYVMTGVAQLLTFLVVTYLGAVMLGSAYDWVSATPGLSALAGSGGAILPVAIELCRRAVTIAVAIFALTVGVPILLKWGLIGRWERMEIPVWSPAYYRFWLVKTAIRSNPMRLFVGSPLYVLYLRALGAKIGKDVLILATNVPVCTDMLTIGDNTVIPKDVDLDGYRAHSGVIQTGRITIGRDVFIGGMSLLDIETSIGDGAQMGYTSSLYAGQSIPAGQTWHGTPARPTDVDYRSVEPAECTTARKIAYTVAQLFMRLAVYPSLGVAGLELLAQKVQLFADPLDQDVPPPAVGQILREALGVSAVTYFGAMLAALIFVWTVPKLLGRMITEDRVYPIYGFYYACQRTIARLTNNGTLTGLFGDSSYIVGYLQRLGYDLGEVEQTGSNFGMAVGHDNPYLCSVGSGTLVSDGLSLINAAYSPTSFRVSRASVGARNFVGNGIAFPAGGKVGDNCLLATKVMIPMHGEVREGVGLLGSPSFEIPRSVRRDGAFEHLKDPDELRKRLKRKNRHNLTTIAIHLAVHWLYAYVVTAIGLATLDVFARYGAQVIAAAAVGTSVLGIVYYVCVERVLTAFRGGLQPQVCSIYEPYFWWHERYWKVPAMGYIGTFSGTPFKGTIWRLLGVKVGRRLFDDGCWMTERSLVTVGDHVTLGATSTIQAHSLEDGAFKSDHITIGSGATLATHAFVHYGTTVGQAAVLAPDSFLMKGEVVTDGDLWLGNPARPANAVIDEDDPEGEGYLGQLLRRIAALEGKIEHLKHVARPVRRQPVAIAASVALLLTAGVAAVLAYPSLATSAPAAWSILTSGVTSGASTAAPTSASAGGARSSRAAQPRAAQPQAADAAADSPDSADGPYGGGSPGSTDSHDSAGDPDTSGTPDDTSGTPVRGIPSQPGLAQPGRAQPGFGQPKGAPVQVRPVQPLKPVPPRPKAVRPPLMQTHATPPAASTPPAPPQEQAEVEVEQASARLKQAKQDLKQAKSSSKQNTSKQSATKKRKD